MNSYAKFGGAVRRHFSAICEKPMGGTYVPPPAVRGLTGVKASQTAKFVFQSLVSSFRPFHNSEVIRGHEVK